MPLPKLYSKDSHGRIRSWEIIVEGNSYKTIAGLEDGAKVTSEPTVCLGKNLGRANETSPEAQAEKEAKSHWNKKVGQEGYFENVEEVDTQTFFNVMLAHEYEKHSHKLPETIWASPKMDGLRCVISKEGVFSRNGKKFPALSYIREELQPLFKLAPNIILDSEAYTHTLKSNFDKLVSLAKKLKPTREEIEEAKKYELSAWIFDMPQGGIYTINDPFKERYLAAESFFAGFTFKFSRLLKYDVCTKTDVHLVEENYIKEGFEGLMARNPHAAYQQKRSYDLLKLKRFIDVELPIIDILKGDGNRSGMMGRMVFHMDGKPFEASARGNEEFYRELLNNKTKYIGALATIRYQNLTPSGVPRFPIVVMINRGEYE